MVDKNLEQRIHKAVNHATPDVLDRILTSCDEQKGIGTNMNNNVAKNVNKNFHKNKWFTPVLAVAAALILISVGGFGINSWKVQHTVNSIVMFDVNPSISLNVNSKERVLSVEPNNEDGKKILGDMDLKNTDLDVVVNALIGSMLQNGYLSDIQNAILVSVENDDQIKGSELQTKIAQIVDTMLKNSQIESAVLSQTLSADSNIKELAKKYNISEGKAALIQEVIQKDPTLTFDTLAPLTVHEIGLIMDSRSINLELVTKTGEVSVKGYISKEEAKAIAYAHAKVSENTVSKAKIEFDSEDGIMVYELEFIVGTIEYKYDIHAVTGEIIKFTKGNDDNQSDQDEDEDGDQDEDNQGQNEDNDDQDDNKGNNQTTSYIGEKKAKAAAFSHAKVSENQVTAITIKFDREGNGAVYEITFETKDAKYEYGINAKNGSVIKSDKKVKKPVSSSNQTTTTKPSQTNTEYISKAKAKEIAFAHAKLKGSQVREFESKFEKKEQKSVYKIQFATANGEYEYVIDAISGKVIKYKYDPFKSKDTSSNNQGGNNQDNDSQGENNQDKNHQGENNQDNDDQGENNQDKNHHGENNQDDDDQGENNQDRNHQGKNNQDKNRQGENNQDKNHQGRNNQDGDDQGEDN